MKKHISKVHAALVRQRQVEWLTLNGYPHHVTQSPEFAAMFRCFDKNFKPIARKTYIDGVRQMYEKHIIQGITKLIQTCRTGMMGLGDWMAFIHDMWTSSSNNSILGSSIAVTDQDMVTYTVACILVKHNKSHGATAIAKLLQETYLSRFKLDLKKEGGRCGSDTTPSARNVSFNLDADQGDCSMHVVALIILYSTGYAENTKLPLRQMK